MANSLTTINTISIIEDTPKLAQSTSCTSIICFDKHTSSLLSAILFLTKKLAREDERQWQPPIRRGHLLIIAGTSPFFMVVEIFEVFIKVTLETRSSDVNGLSEGTTSAPSPCDCGEIFLDFGNILHSMDLSFLAVRLCCENSKSYLSIGASLKDFPTDDYFELDKLVTQMTICRDTMSELLYRSTSVHINGKTGTNGFLTDQEFLTETNELKFQYQNTVKEFQILTGKMKADVPPVLQNGIDKHPMKLQIIKNKRINSLSTLLKCISNRLYLHDWSNMRQYIASYLPKRTLGNIQNGVGVFNELVKRNVIGDDDIEFLRNALYDIERVDLVHLVDCVQEGDLSLLNDLTLKEDERYGNVRDNGVLSGTHDNVPRLSSHDPSDPQMRGLANQNPINLLRDLTLEDNARYWNVRVNGGHSRSPPHEPRDPQDESITPNMDYLIESAPDVRNFEDNKVLPGNNEAVPRRSPVSSEVPLLENATENNEEDDGIEGELNAAGTFTWDENPEVSCEHYDRYCDCQFECCEKFWPCHRCHNDKSSCSSNKLRSRDIKKIKCKRCGLVQEFPKQSPHCTGCNLKFAIYFCAPCKHLTGNETHPFHCNKCGICRVHGDRSFHCDICGVCLDIKLRDNHKCRAGSDHDTCCICSKDAFAGCQILPCSHKVHKECAVQMLRSGITRCPICREDFSHRIDRRRVP